MGKVLNWVVLGLVAAAVMMVAKVLLAHSGWLPHYAGIDWRGTEGLEWLGKDLAGGAAFALLYGFLVKPILPAKVLLAALIFSVLPFLFFTMAWPMWRGRPMETGTWQMVYTELDLYIFSLVLVALGKGGSKEK